MTPTKAFLWNVLLAFFWALATGSITVGTLTIGFLLGLAALWVTRRALGTEGYITKIGAAIGLFFYFLRELIRANLKIAADILTPTHYMKPAILAIPLDAESDEEITLLSSLITLTPGTLSLHISDDRRTLYIHSMYTPDADRMRHEIKTGLEARILKVMR